jgi:fumarate reductase flavoprotein subunit
MIGKKKRKVLVLGAGSAGLAAAVQGAEAGAQVTVLEMHDQPGGVSALSTGLIRGSETFLQGKLKVKDSWMDDAIEMMEQARYTNDPALIARLAENSGSMINWLKELGVIFKEKIIDMPRLHLILPDGKGLIDGLYKGARERGVEFSFDTRAFKLLSKEDKVMGVEAKRYGRRLEFKADAVVLCTGGVWRGKLLRKYSETLKNLIVSYGYPVGGMGDGIRMAKGLGAQLIDLEKIIPNVAKFLDRRLKPVPLGASSSLRHGGGAVFLNQALGRFVNEDLFYVDFAYEVAKELRKRKEKWVWEIWDENAKELVPRVDEYIKLGYIEKGVLTISENVLELAEGMGVNARKLEKTIERYNQFFKGILRIDQDCGKPLGHLCPLEKPPFYAVRVGIECLSTRGGVKIDTEARVLNRRGYPLPNLFAAGDDTGGMHGEGYLTGVSLERAIVYGRIAGDNAATGKLGASVRLGSRP